MRPELVIVTFFQLYFAQAAKPAVRDYEKRCLEKHNSLRAQHSAKPLMISPTLNRLAAECAKYYFTRIPDHSCPKRRNKAGEVIYGENIFQSTKKAVVGMSDPRVIDYAMNGFYSEISNYNFKTSDGINKTGKWRHFTQIVWKESEQLGVALLRQGQKVVVEMLYSPTGNVKNEYADNVGVLKKSGGAKPKSSAQPAKSGKAPNSPPKPAPSSGGITKPVKAVKGRVQKGRYISQEGEDDDTSNENDTSVDNDTNVADTDEDENDTESDDTENSNESDDAIDTTAEPVKDENAAKRDKGSKDSKASKSRKRVKNSKSAEGFETVLFKGLKRIIYDRVFGISTSSEEDDDDNDSQYD